MAEITCTKEEFYKFIGPRIRNAIQYLTKRRKKELGYICQNCNQKRELEAAHIKGSDRKSIIENELKRHIIDESKGIVKVDLEEFEKKIVAAHKPIDKYFKFLCAKCHTEYDSKKIRSTNF